MSTSPETDEERAARHERERLEANERHERERRAEHERHERELQRDRDRQRDGDDKS
ncbi:MAG TPA: hypothetical protein VFO17_09410 [Acidimicrobiia bacterium]|nr:hypothetical protein [Acidimicrobiia bacterium]